MGTGYTRNDTSNNIADGNVINASDLDGEFDAVQAAFNGTTGHSHDGTSGEGPQIAAGGIASNAVTTAKILNSNVTTAKIANDAVTGDKLANNIQIAGTLGVTGQTTLSTHLNMGDNDIIKLGASSDLQIYHDGSHSYISDVGTGHLILMGGNLFLREPGGGNFIGMTDGGTGGTVTLYHNNSSKLATKSDGIDITGELQSDSLDVDGAADISGQVNFHSNVVMDDNNILIIGNGSDLQLSHNGSNSLIADSGTGNMEIRTNGSDVRITGNSGTDFMAQFVSNGEARLHYDGTEKLNTKSDGVEITGELQATSLDINGSGNISGVLTMGGNVDLQDNDKLMIGTSDDLQIYHDASNSYILHNNTGNLYIRQSRDDADIFIQSDNGSGGHTNYVVADGSTGKTLLYQYGSEKLRTESDGIYVTGNVQSSTGVLEGASNQDKIVIGANNRIDFFLDNSNEFRMEADGDFHADGDVVAFSTTVSDERLKTDIEKIENATDKVSQLNGYTFTYKADGKKSAGVIAQEVEKVLPSAVSEKELPLKMDDGVAYKTVQYDQIIGLLIESIKELKQEINELKGV